MTCRWAPLEYSKTRPKSGTHRRAPRSITGPAGIPGTIAVVLGHQFPEVAAMLRDAAHDATAFAAFASVTGGRSGRPSRCNG